MTTASRTKTMNFLSDAWRLWLFIIAWVFLMAMAVPHGQHTPQPGNECRVHVTGLYLPCSKVGPTNYPTVWLSEGQEI